MLKKMNEINFYLRDDEYGFLSNFWRSEQYIHGIRYPTNEHFYQSMKAKDNEIRKWIESAPKPYMAMCAGRSLRIGKEMRDDWTNEKKIEVMLFFLISEIS